jgi:hypothetical protein
VVAVFIGREVGLELFVDLVDEGCIGSFQD